MTDPSGYSSSGIYRWRNKHFARALIFKHRFERSMRGGYGQANWRLWSRNRGEWFGI